MEFESIMTKGDYGEKHPHIRARRVIGRVVLGSSDGIVESISATSALNGAGLNFSTILLAGFSLALGGALSMFFSNYLFTKSELDLLQRDIQREKMEIETEPEEESIELEQFLKKEGYHEKEIDVIMNRMKKDKELWLRAQLRHELHVNADDVRSDSLSKSLPAGITFLLGATIPLLPYLFQVQHYFALIVSVTLSLVTLFVLGTTKFVSLKQISIKNGLEMVSIGAAAAFLLYLLGQTVASFR